MQERNAKIEDLEKQMAALAQKAPENELIRKYKFDN